MTSLLHLFTLFPFFLIFTFIDAQPNNSTEYPSCPSYNCGNITIGYPFWRIGDQTATQYCGYRDFGIDCATVDGREIPSIKLGSNPYYVRNITYDTRAIVLADYDVSPAVNVPSCPRVQHGIDLTTLPFNFPASNVNLSFHFNCTGSPNPSFATAIPCLNFLDRRSYIRVISSETDDSDWRPYECVGEVVTTVFRYILENLVDISINFSRALREGFELGWRKSDNDCEKCEDSDGRCGYNTDTNEFMCFCSGGTSTTDHCKGSKFNWKLALLISVLSAMLIILASVAFYFWRRRRNMKKRYYASSYMTRNISSYASSMTDPEKTGAYHGVQVFKYRELEKATNGFDSANELGDGGFGTVYKGNLRDGRVVAVKRLYENNYKRVAQFMNEIEILAHLRHQNLVSLYGCTTHHSRELLLVYEYIPNGTVADHLHGQKSTPGSLKWTTRMSIAVETASALVYLHASDVIHRDVKTHNILLDNSFGVKVADFGLSRLFPTDVTHVSTAPQGTPGYVDPEYHECYQLTSKSDVYSFGVVLIELISSKPAVDITRHRHEINLSNMAINKIRNDALHELVDPSLGFENDYDVRKMIIAVAELAFQCLQNERDFRPSMDQVLESLVSITNGKYNQETSDDVEGTCDDAVLLKNVSQTMSPDSVVFAWRSTSTDMSTSSG